MILVWCGLRVGRSVLLFFLSLGRDEIRCDDMFVAGRDLCQLVAPSCAPLCVCLDVPMCLFAGGGSLLLLQCLWLFASVQALAAAALAAWGT